MHKICIEYSFIYVPEYREHYGICSGQLQTTVTAIVTVLNTRNKKCCRLHFLHILSNNIVSNGQMGKP